MSGSNQPTSKAKKRKVEDQKKVKVSKKGKEAVSKYVPRVYQFSTFNPTIDNPFAELLLP